MFCQAFSLKIISDTSMDQLILIGALFCKLIITHLLRIMMDMNACSLIQLSLDIITKDLKYCIQEHVAYQTAQL